MFENFYLGLLYEYSQIKINNYISKL